MPRDLHIRRAFEVADDAMQGAIGYFLDGVACRQNAPTQEVLSALPPTQIPITHDWDRYYSPNDLCEVMERYFESYHAWVALIAVIGAFEGALRSFRERLAATGKIANKLAWHYKKKLEWAFSVADQSTYGDLQMQARIPMLCLHVDHARRIRNLWMHNNGLFDTHYAKDGLQFRGYHHRIAISNNRLLKLEGGKVTFRWKDYRRKNRIGLILHRGSFFVHLDEAH